MLRSFADAVETLEDAGACYYTITGAGVAIHYEPETAEAATVEACLARFEKDWHKLSPGAVYTVTHRRTQNGRKGAGQSMFRLTKSWSDDPTGQAPNVAGVGGPAVGYISGDVVQLREQMVQDRHQREIERLEDKHRREIEELKRKHESGNDGDGVARFLGAIGQVRELMQLSQPAPQKRVAAAAVEGPAPELETTEQQRMQRAMENMAIALGGEDALIDTMDHLGSLAARKPADFRQYATMLANL